MAVFILLCLFIVSDCVSGNVQFHLLTRNNPKEGVQLEGDDFGAVNASNPLKFIVHGWGQSRESPFYAEMTDAYLIRGEYNVIQVDWSEWASAPYTQASQNTKKAGKAVGEFIDKLGVPLKTVHIIGHSLGAHVSGFAGKTVQRLRNDTVYRITALDPAGPGFKIVADEQRLSKRDAHMVDVTHTDINYFGYTGTMGTVDFYPNGGHRPQPGCELYNPQLLALSPKQIAFCSHMKSHVYFTESINSDSIVGTKCGSLMEYETGECNDNAEAVYGEDTPFETRGSFYFTTTGDKPFTIRNLTAQFPLQLINIH